MSDGKDADTLVGLRRRIKGWLLRAWMLGARLRPVSAPDEWQDLENSLLKRERWLNGIGFVNDWSWR